MDLSKFNQRKLRDLIRDFDRYGTLYRRAEDSLRQFCEENNICKICHRKPAQENSAGRCHECFEMTRVKFEEAEHG